MGSETQQQVNTVAISQKQLMDTIRLWKIRIYLIKKYSRSIKRQHRYKGHSITACQRFRYKGRFIKKDAMERLSPEEIYDPSNPSKVKSGEKSIFKIKRVLRK